MARQTLSHRKVMKDENETAHQEQNKVEASLRVSISLHKRRASHRNAANERSRARLQGGGALRVRPCEPRVGGPERLLECRYDR